MINVKINFKGHLNYACKRAENTTVSLAQMLPNTGGTRYNRKLLVIEMVRSSL